MQCCCSVFESDLVRTPSCSVAPGLSDSFFFLFHQNFCVISSKQKCMATNIPTTHFLFLKEADDHTFFKSCSSQLGSVEEMQMTRTILDKNKDAPASVLPLFSMSYDQY